MKFFKPSDSIVSYQYGLSISTLRRQFKGVTFPLYNETLIDFGGFLLFLASQEKYFFLEKTFIEN
jgi:hypothetical protein